MGCCQSEVSSTDTKNEALYVQDVHIKNNSSDMQSKKRPSNTDSLNSQQMQVQSESQNQSSKSTSKMINKTNTQDLLENYNIGKVLGEGGFGIVCLATQKSTQITRAMKIINKKRMSKSDENQFYQELKLLKDIDHPNIVKVFEHYQDDKCHYLISEYCSGGEIFDRVRSISPFTEKVAATYMKQILSAISYSHIYNICHRDLKPENILFDSYNNNSYIKVIDLGATTRVDLNNKFTRRIGSPYYVAPEVLNKQQYDEKGDVWSLGVIMYILLCGYPPFNGSQDSEIFDKIKKGKYEFDKDDWDCISNDAKELINKMLVYNPADRISATEAYAHPWIQSNVYVEPLDEKVMKKFNIFCAKNKIKSALMYLASSQLLSSSEKNNLLKSFQLADKNQEGVLTKDEIISSYEKILNDKFKAYLLVDKVAPELDQNQTGKIDYQKFIMVCLNKEKMLAKDKIDKSLKLVDIDNTGQLSKAEIEELMSGLYTNQQLQAQLIAESDKNRNGAIQISIFLDLLMVYVEKDFFTF